MSAAAAAAAAIKQHVLSLCLLSSGGHKTLCSCKILLVFCLCITVCVMHHVPRQCLVWICLNGCVYLLGCLSVCECVFVWPLYPPATETQRSVLTVHLQPWLPPFSEIKSLFSQAAYWVRVSKHRCSASWADNMGFKDHLRLPAHAVKALCVGPDLIYPRRSTWQSILHWVTVDFLFVD